MPPHALPTACLLDYNIALHALPTACLLGHNIALHALPCFVLSKSLVTCIITISQTFICDKLDCFVQAFMCDLMTYVLL